MPTDQQKILVVKCNCVACTVWTIVGKSQPLCGPVELDFRGAHGQSKQRDYIRGRRTKG